MEFLPTRPLLCGSVCRVIDNGRPLYVDDDHLSIHGAVNVLAPGLSTRLRL